MEANYEKFLDKISKISAIEKEELDRRVEAKRAKLSGLISRDGALQVIAAELGISFDNEKLKIDELLPGMRKVNFTGKVIFISPVREFTTKSGDVGKVVNLIVADETSNVKVVLWDLNHISLIESGEVSLQDSVEIVSGNMRDSEVHLGSFSEFKKSNKTFGEVKTKEVVKEKNIAGLVVGEKVKLRAFIVQSFDPRFFEVNPETGRKITEEELASGVPTEKRAILNCVLDDGTDSIRAVMFHENVQKTGVKSFDNPKMLEQEKMNLLGKEFYFVGNVRKNSYFQNTELIVDSLEEVKAEKLLEKLENQ